MNIGDRRDIEKRFNSMRNEFQSWVPGLRDIRDYMAPGRGFFDDSTANFGVKYDHKKNLNNSPMRALRTLASGMMSGLTSPSRPWFKLGVQDAELMELDEVKEWLEDVQTLMYTIFSRSNIYNVLHTLFGELGGFGTGSAIIEEDFDTVIHGTTFTAGEYYFGLDHKGRVNSFGRSFKQTVGQLVKEYGIDNVSPTVKNLYSTGQIDGWVKVRHLIEPNDRKWEGVDQRIYKPYRSIAWEDGSATDTCLRYKGYEEFPVLGPRWDVTSTSYIYGRSPGWDAIGDVKQLMKMEYDKLMALDKMIDPPTVSDGLSDDEPSTLPGGRNKVSAGVPNSGLRPAYQIDPRLQEIEAMIERVKNSIDQTFYADLFLMLTQIDRGQMTAREIAERHEEKLLALGPVLERLQGELLGPLIDRTFQIMLRTGILPTPPDELQGTDLKVDYISLLAQAQKMVGTTAIQAAVAFAGNMAAVYPEVVDVIDPDEAVIQYSDMMGVSPKIIRSKDELAAYRAERAKQRQQAQMAAAIPEIVKGAKTLSDTKLGQGSALDAMVGTDQPQAVTQ